MFLSLAVVIGVFIISYRAMSRSFYLGAGLYFLETATAWHMPTGIILGNIGGFTVTLGDITAACSVIFAASHRDKIAQVFGSQWSLFLLFSSIVMVSILRGVATFGVQQAVNEARYVVYFLACIAWFAASQATSTYVALLAWRRFTIFGSMALLGLQSFNIALHGLGSASEEIALDSDTVHNSRSLMPIQSMFLLLTLTLLITTQAPSTSRSNVWLKFFPWILVVGIVAAQQRSVWMATIASFVIFLFHKKARTFALSFLVASLFSLGVFIELGTFFAPIARSLQDSVGNSSTFFAREGSWIQYLGNFSTSSALDQWFGKPFGSGWGRYDGLNHIWVDWNPHNWYIFVLLRTGLLGLSSIVLFYSISLIGSIMSKTSRLNFGVVQVQQLVFQFFYPIPWQIPMPAMSSRDPKKSLVFSRPIQKNREDKLLPQSELTTI